MGYRINDGEYYMGCLADVHDLFENDGYRGDMTINLYSGLDRGGIMLPTDERLGAATCKAVFKEITDLFPLTIWESEEERDEVIETGNLVLNDNTDNIVLHAKLAPFRLFFERSSGLKFYQDYKHVDPLGAFIAAHVVTWSCARGQWKVSHGWHQSMFTSLYANTGSIGYKYQRSMRRLVALHPEYRKFFACRSPIAEDYAMPDLNSELTDYLGNMDVSSWPSWNEGDTLTNPEELVTTMRKWYDTVMGLVFDFDQGNPAPVTATATVLDQGLTEVPASSRPSDSLMRRRSETEVEFRERQRRYDALFHLQVGSFAPSIRAATGNRYRIQSSVDTSNHPVGWTEAV